MASPSSVIAVIRAVRPRFTNQHDRIAFAVHAAFLSIGYRLVAAGAAADYESSDEREEVDVGLDGWNEVEGTYAFRYAGEEGLHKRLVVKCLAVGDTLLVDVAPIAAGQLNEPVHSQIRVSDYAAKDDSPNCAQQYTNLGRLLEKFNKDIVGPLTPSRPCQGRREAPPEQPTRSAREPPLANRPYQSSEGGVGRVPPSPLGIGAGDLLPGGGGGIFPSQPGGMGRGGGGGMMLGPHDPYWGQMGGPDGSFPPGGLPPGVPPGARFDPFGPPGVPGFEPDRFMRNGRRGPPGGPPTHPDLEQFRND